MGAPARARAGRAAPRARGRARTPEARGRGEDRLTIRVGVLLPLSGPWKATGERCRDAVEFARELTAADGTAGDAIETVFADDNTADEAERETARLIDADRVSVIVGTVVSPDALRASAVAASRGVPYFEVAAVVDELTERALPAVFRFSPQGSTYGAAVVRFAAEALAPILGRRPDETGIALLYNDNELGRSIAAGARREAGAAGVRIARDRAVSAAESAESLADELSGGGTDVLFLVQLLDRMADVVRLLRRRRAPIRAIVGSAGWGYRRSATSADAADGTFVVGAPSLGTFRVDGQSAEAQRDMSAWMARCGDAGPAHNLDVALDRDLFFAGARTLFRTLADARAPADPAAVTRLLRGLDLPLGSTPLGFGVRFGASGENERSFVTVSQWRGDRRHTVWPDRLAIAAPEPSDAPGS